MSNPSFFSALAKSILAGDAEVEAIVERTSRTLGRNWRWLRPLARRYVAAFGAGARPRRRQVAAFLREDEGLHSAQRKYGDKLRIAAWLHEPQRMQPEDTALGWKIPAIESVGGLAAWMHVTVAELEWLADLKRLSARSKSGAVDGPVGHYHYRVLAKKAGSLRLIEAPKRKLKKMQRKILEEILKNVPVHPAVHGFVSGRSIKTFATPHVGRRVVLRMDLKDFFASVSGARIQAFFRTAGYPEPVADLLGSICTNSTPRRLWAELGRDADPVLVAEARRLYARNHLPQGAPPSPALANLCTYRVDCRLRGLAEAAGAVYTRYADDLAFSGEDAFEIGVGRFALQAAAILQEEGFTVNHRKTRIMRRGVRQHLTGLVTNERVNVVRADFDRLKAILTNCVRHGPESQNREGHPSFRLHLAGRVGFVESINPAKGERLRRLFAQIRW